MKFGTGWIVKLLEQVIQALFIAQGQADGKVQLIVCRQSAKRLQMKTTDGGRNMAVKYFLLRIRLDGKKCCGHGHENGKKPETITKGLTSHTGVNKAQKRFYSKIAELVPASNNGSGYLGTVSELEEWPRRSLWYQIQLFLSLSNCNSVFAILYSGVSFASVNRHF